MGMDTFLITNCPKKRSGLLIFWKYRWKTVLKSLFETGLLDSPDFETGINRGSELMSQRDIGVCRGEFGRFE